MTNFSYELNYELNPIDYELNPIDIDNTYEKININGYSYWYKLSEVFFDDIVDWIAKYFFK